MMKETMAYVGAVFAIVLGLVLLWAPPAILAGQASTVGQGFAFITGGLGALGVTVTAPQAYKSGYLLGYSDKSRSAEPRYR